MGFTVRGSENMQALHLPPQLHFGYYGASRAGSIIFSEPTEICRPVFLKGRIPILVLKAVMVCFGRSRRRTAADSEGPRHLAARTRPRSLSWLSPGAHTSDIGKDERWSSGPAGLTRTGTTAF